MTEAPQTNTLPTATVAPARSSWWVWLIPIAALLFAAALIASYVVKQGPVITIQMTDGYGLKPTDVLRCRGIVVGEIEDARIHDDGEGVSVRVRLNPTAEHLARKGSRFWVVRPKLELSGIAGLETVAGPRYISVLPGPRDGEAVKEFTALNGAPPVERIDPDGLRVQLVSDRRGSLRPGAPVLYRQFNIGAVLSVELADDGKHVQVWVYIEPAYKNVIRVNSQWANVSGFEWSFGFTEGARVEVESLQSLLDGGVAVFTPNKAGELLNGDYRFQLAPRPEEEWYEWQPDLKVGQAGE